MKRSSRRQRAPGRRLRRVMATTVVLLGTGVAITGPPSHGDNDAAWYRVFTIRSQEITESSSLVVSTTHPGLAYTTNDSGDGATIYVLDTSTGAVVGHTSLARVDPIDIEGMAGGSDGSLVVGDVGDNDADRSSVAVYRIEQPADGDRRVVAERLRLVYADGPRNAESVMYDARSGRVFVVSKEAVGASIYATPPHVFTRRQAVLRPVAEALTGLATDATLLANRRFAVIRTYVDAAIYRYPSWQPLHNIGLPAQPQGESVAAPPGGREIWVGTEGVRSGVLAVRLPPLPTSPTQRPTTPTDPDAASDDSGLLGGTATMTAGLALGIMVLVAVGLLRFARRR